MGGLYGLSSFFLGASSVFITGGQGLLFTTLKASLDFSSLARLPVVRIACVWLTSITIRNVGSVVATFFGYGGRMGIGIRPRGKEEVVNGR